MTEDLDLQAWQYVAEKHPHIHQRLKEIWGTKECVDYFNQLYFLDHSENTRLGFPYDSMRALNRIHEQHDREFSFLKPFNKFDHF